MDTQDQVNKALREQIGGLMIDLIIAKVEVATRDATITELKAELESFKSEQSAQKVPEEIQERAPTWNDDADTSANPE